MSAIPAQWTLSAQSDLRAVHDFIVRDSPHYDRQTVDQIRRTAERLAAGFSSGAIVLEWDDPGLREVYARNYRVIGRCDAGSITVVAVIHSARLLSDSL